jgi:hypothetical protein
MTSPGSESAIIDQIIVSVSPTSSPANIRLHTLDMSHTVTQQNY